MILSPVVFRMERQLRQWESTGDRKAVFLGCYTMMTRNMYTAVDSGDFSDAAWVRRLLEHFADYYFKSLETYGSEPAKAASVWRAAHEATAKEGITPVQLLFLGVNAHINYDLVLALEDLLAPEWGSLHPAQRTDRHADYCQVNAIIARTIDAVQDSILSPAMPLMGVVDTMMGRLDELLISSILTRWRDEVWQSALALLEVRTSEERAKLVEDVEMLVMERAAILASPDMSIVRKLL